jgi:TonB family protein
MQPADLKDYVPLPLPWTEEPEQKKRLRQLVAASLGFFISLFLVISLVIEPPRVEREQLEKVPERLAKVMLERKRQPPPPPPKPPEPKPEKPKPEPEKPKPKPKPEPEKPKPVTKLKPKKPLPEKLKKAREKAAKSGVMAMQKQLQALQDLPALSDLANKPLRDAKPVTTARKRPDLIGRRAADGSGGIQTTAVANPQRATLAGRQTTRVDAPEEVLAMVEQANNKDQVKQRSREEINLVFDRHKSAFYALYRRALRTHLGLQGRVVFEFSIAPSGQVTDCKIVSSELNNAELERKLRARVMLMPFDNKPVESWQGQYHIDFLPAG